MVASGRVGAWASPSPPSPSVVLDTNVWSYVGESGSLQRLRREAKMRGVSVVACPAVLEETLRIGDPTTRSIRVEAMTRQVWFRIMPESFWEAGEVYHAIAVAHPDWLDGRADMSDWWRLKADWQGGGWWARCRSDPTGTAELLVELQRPMIDAARGYVERNRQFYRDHYTAEADVVARVRRGMAKPVSPLAGWDGDWVEEWRLNAHSVWSTALADEESPMSEWLHPWLDTSSLSVSAWNRFWLYEVELEALPLTWVRWALDLLQSASSINDGSARDNQIGSYAVMCDYFATADKRLAHALNVLQTSVGFPMADVILVKQENDCVDQVFSFQDTARV